MKQLLFISFLMLLATAGFSQGYLGQSKDSLLKLNPGCAPEANYKNELAFKCDGNRSIFYFKNGVCDLWAVDLKPESANDTLNKLLREGYVKAGAKYVEAFLVSPRYPNHQKFPSTVYSKGNILYSIMPVSLDGKTGNLNSLVVMYVKKDIK